MLYPNSTAETTFLLSQIIDNLPAIVNGTFHRQSDESFEDTPDHVVVLVNCIWLVSFLLSMTSALLATSMQHWARRYTQLPQIPNMPSDRARVRSFLFLGTFKYDIHHAVEIAPTLLHLSVLLFTVGLVIYFSLVLRVLYVIILVFFMLFVAAYFTLTILPCIDPVCPYSTPLSGISWRLWHGLAFSAECILKGILWPLHAILALCGFREFTRWLDRIGNDLNRHKQCFRAGFRESIVEYALRAPRDTDIKALNWLLQLPALARNHKIERLVASLPGTTTIQLFTNPRRHGKITFRGHLTALLQSCAPGMVGLDERTRRHRLLACLGAVHHIARASIIPNRVPLSPYLLNDVRIKFANIPLMRALWAEEDLAIRVTARSICALLARHLLRERPLEQPELTWLQDVMGQPSNTISNRLNDLPAVDDMNLDSFVYGVLPDQTDHLPIVQATVFVRTLAILMNLGTQAVIDRDIFADKLISLIRRIEGGGHRGRDNVIDKLLDIFQDVFPSAGPLPQTPNP